MAKYIEADRWFMLNTGQRRRDDIQDRLTRAGYATYVPARRVAKAKSARAKAKGEKMIFAEYPLLPRHVFVRADLEGDEYRFLRIIKKWQFGRLLPDRVFEGANGFPLSVSDDELSKWRLINEAEGFGERRANPDLVGLDMNDVRPKGRRIGNVETVEPPKSDYVFPVSDHEASSPYMLMVRGGEFEIGDMVVYRQGFGPEGVPFVVDGFEKVGGTHYAIGSIEMFGHKRPMKAKVRGLRKSKNQAA